MKEQQIKMLIEELNPTNIIPGDKNQDQEY